MSRKILITGAGGYLGHHLIQQILSETNWEIAAITSKPKALEEKYSDEPRVCCYDNACIFSRSIPVDGKSALVHLAFARRFSKDREIAESIEFARRVFLCAQNMNVREVVYVSTQGVYGNAEEMRNVYTSPPSPCTLYTMAKYAGECVLNAIFARDSQTRVTAIRLDSVAGNQKMLPAFVKDSAEKRHISVIGGTQVFSFLDVRDAASGMVALLKMDASKRKTIYNLGWNQKRYTITELAQITAEVAKQYGVPKVSISLERKEIAQFAGMDSSEFISDTGWKPQYDMWKIIDNLFDEYSDRSCST